MHISDQSQLPSPVNKDSAKELQNLLEKEFQKHQILQRPCDGGKTLNYLETASVIQRLNQVFQYRWSVEIINDFVDKDEIVVRLRLKISDGSSIYIKEAYGGTTRKRRKNSDQYANSLADDLKSAQSDALKKVASYLGIGLSLYSSVDLQPFKKESEDKNGITSNNKDQFKSSESGETNRPAKYAHYSGNGFGNRVGNAIGKGVEPDRTSQRNLSDTFRD